MQQEFSYNFYPRETYEHPRSLAQAIPNLEGATTPTPTREVYSKTPIQPTTPNIRKRRMMKKIYLEKQLNKLYHTIYLITIYLINTYFSPGKSIEKC